MHTQLLHNWTREDFQALEEGVLVARHRLAETGLFSDEALIEILDSHPEEHVSITTMGHDTKVFQWREGERNGVPAADLLRLVREGHLWINVRRMMDFQPRHAALINALYDELQYGNKKFTALQRTANLLISSPDALVHYHVDMPVNMLWHIRGRKRVWVYPHHDQRFVSSKVMELVCVGKLTEDVPYDPSYDEYALVFDAEPGQLITWPQHAPHRVTNLEGLNVSLSTEHKNSRAIRRINVHEANHFFRNTFGWSQLSTGVDGPIAHFKQAVARSVRFAKKFNNVPKEQFTYPKTFVVDLQAKNGIRWCDTTEEVVAPHEDLELMHA